MKIWFKFFFTAALINTALFKNINNNADISSEENTQNSIKTLESVDVDAITIDTVTIESTNKINIIENNLNKISNSSTNSESSTTITNELMTNVNLLKNATINSDIVNTEYMSSISRNMLTIVPESSTELNNFETDEENEETYKSNENTDSYENESDLNLFINHEATSKITTLTDDLTDSELKNSKDAEVLLTSSTNHETQTAFPENTTYKSRFNSSINHELLAASESKSLNSTTTNNKEMFPNSSSNNNFQKNDSNVATNDTILNSSEADKSLKNYYWLLKEETDYGSTPLESEKSEITSYTLVPTVTFLSTEKVDEGKTSDTSTESTTELTSEYPSSTPSFCSDNVQVKGLEITPSPYSLSLTWSPIPEDDLCSFKYEIEWKNEVEENHGTAYEPNFTIDDLNACEEYEISVTVVYFDSNIINNPVRNSSATTEAIDAVEYLDIKEITENELVISWSIPPRVEKCLKKYIFKMYLDDHDTPSFTLDPPQNYLTINNIKSCVNTIFEVTALSEKYRSNEKSVSRFYPKPNDPPIYNEKKTEISDNFVITKWTFGKFICRPKKFYVLCNIENQEPQFAVEGEFNVQSNELSAKIDKVEPNTKYSCCGIIENSEGESECSEPGRFSTKPKPPDAPKNLKITEFDEYLNIKWEPPNKWNGKENNYNVSIEFQELKYVLPEYCQNISFDPIEETLDASETEFNFSTIIPASRYKISVKAKSDGGWGQEIEQDFYLAESIPEEPVMTAELFNPTSLNLSWTTPCKMHGKLQKYHYILSGIKEDCESDYKEGDIIRSEDDNDYYSKIFDNLKYDYNYTIQLHAENEKQIGATAETTVITPPGCPDAPENLNITEYDEYLNIKWEPPKEWNGKKENYYVLIVYQGLNYDLPEYCQTVSFDPFEKTLDTFETELNFSTIIPASRYKISVKAKSNGGWGKEIENTYNLTESIPEKPQVTYKLISSTDRNYNTSLNLTWSTPCNMHGKLYGFRIKILGTRDKFDSDDKGIENIPFRESQYYWEIYEDLKPDYKYTVEVQARNEHLGDKTELIFYSPAGIPNEPNVENLLKPNASAAPEPWKSAIVYLKNDMFDQTMGDIIYYAIIVATEFCAEAPKYNIYINWPTVSADNSSCNGDSRPYIATPEKWNPFIEKSSKEYNYILGEGNSTELEYNKALKPSTNYSIKIRGFTKNGFSDTDLFYVQTEALLSDVPVGLIVGLIVGILAIAFLIAAVLFYTKGKLNIKNWPRMESTSQISPAPLPVPIKKFGSHYEKMIENPGKIKNEFQLLSTISSDVTLSTKTALLPINKKKNRYINILPYDQTRVKLQENNANSSDYINASYIKGYGGSNEYIASQGPTEATCPAFWQMILEQNVKLIVMLTQFVESGKDKCYKYFPDLKEEYDLLNEIKIQCVEEEILNVYNKRVFKVIKNNAAKKVTHIQFNLWPDFGVPDEVHHMIDFCEIIRVIKSKKPSIIVMHCSAGVGRTGTLIAVDILLQSIRDKRKVDIFGTVLNLRKQRMTMVQSERQYEFLYKCVYYVINNKSSIVSSKHNLDQITESNM